MRRIDLALDGGDLPLVPRHVTGVDLVLQRARRRLLVFAGEWVLDVTQGMPLLAWRQLKPAPLGLIEAQTREELSGVPGVLQVLDCAASHDVDARRVRVRATARVHDPDDLEAAAQLARVELELGGSTTPAITTAILGSGGIVP